MKTIDLTLTAAIALSLASCAQGELPDFGTEANQNQQSQEEIDNAENVFGITIDKNHTWTMTSEKTVRIVNFPANFETKEVAIYDANPFVDTTAAFLTYKEEALETITYEVPNDLETLYAACINADGVMRVKAFNVDEGTVDMQDDGITRSAAAETRAEVAVGTKFDLTWYYTSHTKLELPGWDDRYAQIDRGNETVALAKIEECYNTALTWVPEGQNNIKKLLNYDEIFNYTRAVIAKEGGEVTLLPVYKKSGSHEYIGYFYEVPGQNLNFKTCDKYVFSEGIYDDTNTATGTKEVNAYKLVYYDENGNGSYQFPKGTKIYLFLCYREKYDRNCFCKDFCNWYSMGILNVDMNQHRFDEHNINPNIYYGKDGWMDFPRVCFFNRNGINYVGCEDGTDFDLNDLLITVQGDVEDFPDVATPKGSSLVYTYAFEDTKMGDYDMNDVVFQVTMTTVNKEYVYRVKLMALGAYDELKLYYRDKTMTSPVALFNGKELHEVFGIPTREFANTREINVTKLPTCDVKLNKEYALKDISFAKADFYVHNVTKNTYIHLPSAEGLTGATPLAICIPCKWSWPTENTNVPKAYPEMAGYAEDFRINIDWYKTFNPKKVLLLE